LGLTGTSQSDVCSTIADVSCVDIAVATVQDRTRCIRMFEGREKEEDRAALGSD
jgi:hypothetical protein